VKSHAQTQTGFCVAFEDRNLIPVLMTKPQALNKRLISREILVTEVLKQFAALSDHYEKSPARVKILFMNLHVLRELPDARGEYRYLHLRRSGVSPMRLVLLDNLLFQLLVDQILHSYLSKNPPTQADASMRLSV
jgi:hypothetical protein